jgi:arylsulfatase A-like enzyme
MRLAVFHRKIMLMFFSLLFFPAVCAGGQGRAGENGKYNLVLIDISCLSADHLSCYGYPRQTSPVIDRLSREGIWFTQTASQAYWTLPSVASVLTGRYVPSHRVENRNQRLRNSTRTLADVLKSQGYRTAAFVGGLDLDASHNLGLGFEVYSDDTGDNPIGSFAQTFPRAVEWLARNGRGPFFLFIQGYDVHPSFVHPAEYVNKFDPDYRGVLDSIIAHYDGAIAYTDSLLGDFMERLQKSGLAGKTVVVIFSDHGEALYGHGSFDRFGKADLYDEVVHVPLVIQHPKIKSVKIDHQAQLIDIFPTVLDLLDIYRPDGIQGRSLYSLITTGFPPVDGEYAFGGWGGKEMVRTAGWKLIFDGKEFELYDIVRDRGEKLNCITKNAKIAADLARQLFSWHVKNYLITPSGKGGILMEDMPLVFQGTSKKGSP